MELFSEIKYPGRYKYWSAFMNIHMKILYEDIVLLFYPNLFSLWILYLFISVVKKIWIKFSTKSLLCPEHTSVLFILAQNCEMYISLLLLFGSHTRKR